MFLADPPSDPASVRLFGFAFRAENFNPCPTLPCWSFWEFLCSSISLVGVGQVYTTLLCLAVKHIFIKRRKKMMLTGSVIEPCWQRCAARMALLRPGRQYSLPQSHPMFHTGQRRLGFVSANPLNSAHVPHERAAVVRACCHWNALGVERSEAHLCSPCP